MQKNKPGNFSPAILWRYAVVKSVVKYAKNRRNKGFFAACKSAGYAFGGSNPPSPTKPLKVL